MLLLEQGETLPTLTAPDMQKAYRFVFSNTPERNHLPACILKPSRTLPAGMRTSGYALSCFTDEDKAEARYQALHKTFKLISKTIGDSLAEGTLLGEHGMMSAPDELSTHFDFYEYASFDASLVFTLKRPLL